jgi:hypothetical protein
MKTDHGIPIIQHTSFLSLSRHDRLPARIVTCIGHSSSLILQVTHYPWCSWVSIYVTTDKRNGIPAFHCAAIFSSITDPKSPAAPLTSYGSIGPNMTWLKTTTNQSVIKPPTPPFHWLPSAPSSYRCYKRNTRLFVYILVHVMLVT